MSEYAKKFSSSEIQVPNVDSKYVKIANIYCHLVDYQKINSSLNFPMASRNIEDNNVSSAE